MYHLSHWCKWFVFLSTVGPHFVSDPVASQEVVINGEINLTCSAEGFPRPSIVWFMNNTMINDSGKKIRYYITYTKLLRYAY